MIHSYDTTVALAEQRRSHLEAEAGRHRLVRDARRARCAGVRPIPHHLRDRAIDVLTRLEARLSNVRRRLAANTESTLRAVPPGDVVDLAANATAELAELFDARSDRHSRATRCG